MYKALAILSITAIVTATPFSGWVGQGQGPTGLQTNYEATFEDIDSDLLSTFVPTRQIGPYDGLDYQGVNK